MGIVELLAQQTHLVPLVEDDHVIEEFTMDRADQPLHKGVGLSRRLHPI